MAFCAGIAATILGTMAAIALNRHAFIGRKLLKALFLAPLSLPGIILGLALLQFLARYGLPRNVVSLALTHIIITMPFAIRFVGVALLGVDPNVERAAAQPRRERAADVLERDVAADQARASPQASSSDSSCRSTRSPHRCSCPVPRR